MAGEARLARLVTTLTLVALEHSKRPAPQFRGVLWLGGVPNIQCKGEDAANQAYLRQQADEERRRADAAIAAASKTDPLLQRLTDKATALDDWESGKAGPIDVHKMPTGEAQIALYNDAKTTHDAGRIGRGYGSLASGANPNYVASLDKQNELQRGLAASGALEQNVNTALANKDIMLGNLGSAGDARAMNIAGMQNTDAQQAAQQYATFIGRPKPGFLKSLALAAVGGGAGFTSAGGAGFAV